ncbi:methyltransferase [Nonomuraea aridisoli]|uniref:O-methyltransferase C-terminal domain-containing protein n=1 Tax=Nonomuraea aridisoli TaxID=2070368 RepID=A0A2W2FBK0_9ACTN|nr:methyltransferase [Nonomuraea aridisoli]PZG22228.1 hypothetical protein C1J01_04365 [Nonomuraea aridisoli]
MNEDLLTAIDTTGISLVVDVGGGSGALVRGLLAAHPELRGISLDLAHATPGAQEAGDKDGLGDRFTAVTGDFFDSVPAADLYLLKTILHDWDDEDCVKILRNCRASARPGARALVVENIIGPLGTPGFEPLADMHMLAMLPGQERDLAEFDALYAASGWRRQGDPTPTGFQFQIQNLVAI